MKGHGRVGDSRQVGDDLTVRKGRRFVRCRQTPSEEGVALAHKGIRGKRLGLVIGEGLGGHRAGRTIPGEGNRVFVRCIVGVKRRHRRAGDDGTVLDQLTARRFRVPSGERMTRPFRCRQDPGVADRNADRGRCDRDALARIQGDGDVRAVPDCIEEDRRLVLGRQVADDLTVVELRLRRIRFARPTKEVRSGPLELTRTEGLRLVVRKQLIGHRSAAAVRHEGHEVLVAFVGGDDRQVRTDLIEGRVPLREVVTEVGVDDGHLGRRGGFAVPDGRHDVRGIAEPVEEPEGDGVAIVEPLGVKLRDVRTNDSHPIGKAVAAFCGIVPAVEIIVVARGGRQVVGLVDIGGDRVRRYRAALRIEHDRHRFLLPDRVECDESVRRRIELVTGLEHRFTRGEGRARGFGVRRPARDLITPAAAFPPGDAPRHIADGDLDRVRVDQSPFAVGTGESAIVGLVDEIVLEPREARCRVQIVVPVRRIIGIPADGKEVICRRGDDAGRGNIGEPGIARIAKTVPEHPLVKRIASRRDGGQPDGGRGREKNQPVGRDGRILVRLRMPIAVEVVIRLCDGDHRRRVDDERRHHPRKPGQKLPHNALSFFRRRVTGS